MRFETLMRKACRAGMVASVLVCGFGLTSHAQADYLAFGGTGYHDATLTLDFAGGASATLSTNALETGNRPAAQGWWSASAANFNGNANYIAGNAFGTAWRDFFVFDFTGQAGTVTAAALNLFTGGIVGGPLSYGLWDVATPLAALQNLGAGPNAAIYHDLGSGVGYGGYPLDAAESSTIQGFALNTAGIGAINAALGGQFAIGGSAAASVAEPAGVGMVGLGLAVLGLLRIRRRS